MNRPKSLLACVLSLAALCQFSAPAYAANTKYRGTQYDIGGTVYPGGSLPYVTVPWRSTSANNIYAVYDESPDQCYGHEGYALFATTFTYPDASLVPSNSNIDPNDPDFANVLDLPSWVADSQILAERLAGGYDYALIDDPVLQHGIRYWSFNGVTAPEWDDPNYVYTEQNPYTKMGFLTGGDIFGNNTLEEPTARWAFTVGPNAPYAFRLGVMSGGDTSEYKAPIEVFLQEYEGLTPAGEILGSGPLVRNRFVDMHFFDIVGAEEGDTFVIGAMAGENSFGVAGIAGFSFDVLPYANADFDSSGKIDGNDFLIWQQHNGLTGGATLGQGDSNDDGNVDADDLYNWELQYGYAPPPPPLASASQIPEPASLLLVVTGLWYLSNSRRERMAR